MSVGNYRFYQDLNGNQYRWYVQKQPDGKFHAKIIKVRSGAKTITRISTKKKNVIKWCKTNYRKENSKQIVEHRLRNEKSVIKKIKQDEMKEQKRELKESRKPKFTKEETKLLTSLKQKDHFGKLVKKCDKSIKLHQLQIKSLTTRKKTYEKKIKHYTRKYEKILADQKLRVER